MTQKPNLLQVVERNTRAFSVDSGGPDILGGPCLFCVVAIMQNRMKRDDALRATHWVCLDDFNPYPGAKCPSYSAPVRIACETASRECRDLELGELWNALHSNDPLKFAELCNHYSIL